MRDKIYHLRPSKRKYAMLIVVALLLITVGMYVVIDPLHIKPYSENTHVYWGLFFITLGGGGLLVGFKNIFMNKIEITISDKGIEPIKLGIGIIPWDHINYASINSWRYMFHLAINLREEKKSLYDKKIINDVKVFKKLGFGDLFIPLPYLTLSQSEINNILRDFLRYR